MSDKNKALGRDTVAAASKRRKKCSFYRSRVLVFGQVFLWILIAVVLTVLWVTEKDDSSERLKEFALLTVLCEAAVSVTVPLTFLRVEFSGRYVKEKALLFTVKKIAAEDIRQIGIFEKTEGRSHVCTVFFSGRYRDVSEINRCFERGWHKDIIFLSYPQKDLKNVLEERFPDKFDEKNTFVPGG